MAGTRAYGASITVGGSAVGGLLSIVGSGRSAEIIDTTQHRTGVDAAKNYREKMGGLIDSGQVAVTVNYIKDDVGQEKLRDEIGNTLACVITWSDATSASFDAIVSEANLPSVNDVTGKMEQSFTLDITGKPTSVG